MNCDDVDSSVWLGFTMGEANIASIVLGQLSMSLHALGMTEDVELVDDMRYKLDEIWDRLWDRPGQFKKEESE